MFLATVKIMAIAVTVFSISLLFYIGSSGSILTVNAQSDLPTTKHRDLIIDLGNNITTNAKLLYPSVGQGPYPGVLLIHGYGPTDMNGTRDYIRIDNETGSKIYPTVRTYFQIAEYLSDRGFSVLLYDKRGVGENHTVSDINAYGNITFNDLKQDAEKALEVLIQQPEVDANKVTLIGHSEGTMIVPRVAIDNPQKVDSIVLMGAAAQNLHEIIYYQLVTRPTLYVQDALDHNHDGLLSAREASEDPLFNLLVGNITLFLTQDSTSANGTVPQQQQLDPNFNTNNDTFISINEEIKPRLIAEFESYPGLATTEKCDWSCPILFKSHQHLTPNLDIIGKVPSDTSILILNGENDSQTFPQQAFLLQQRLTELNHPDHTLKTYPDLGHLFYPSNKWLTSTGPIQENVLQDLFDWLSDPAREFTKVDFISSSHS